MKDKLKFLFQGAGDGIHYFKCKICKDVFDNEEAIEHLDVICEKPLTRKQRNNILTRCFNKAVKNGYNPFY